MIKNLIHCVWPQLLVIIQLRLTAITARDDHGVVPAGDPVGALPLRVPHSQRDSDERPEEGVDGG